MIEVKLIKAHNKYLIIKVKEQNNKICLELMDIILDAKQARQKLGLYKYVGKLSRDSLQVIINQLEKRGNK
jgi:hypothetical protein